MLCLSQISKAIGGLITIFKQRLKQNKTVETPIVSGLKKKTDFLFQQTMWWPQVSGISGKESASGDLPKTSKQATNYAIVTT